MTFHIDCTTPAKLESFCEQVKQQADDGKIVSLAEAAKAADLKRIIARKIEFHHMITEGDRVFISYRRAAGVAEKLIVKTKNPSYPETSSYGVFRVRLDDGSATEEHPTHLTKSIRQ
jgi:hypothetical protein